MGATCLSLLSPALTRPRSRASTSSDSKSSGNDSSQIARFWHAESSIPTCTTSRTPCGTAHSGTLQAGTPLKGMSLADIVTLSDRRNEDQRSA